jgi:hypothetical protein
VPEAVAAQPELPLTPAAPPAVVKPAKGRFVIPDDAVLDTPAPASKATAESAGATPDAQNTGDEATPATPEAKPEEPETPEQAAKRQGRRFERKLDKAYRQRAEAQARAEFLQQELEKVKQTPAAAKAAEGEPTLAQFDYDPEKYAAAKADYAKTQAVKEFESKQKQQSAHAEHAKLISSWEEKVAKAEDKFDDFHEVVGDLQPNTPFVAAIMHADNGPDVAHYLGKHASEAESIAKLPPLQQVFEIGKLAAKLSATPVQPKAPSKAPAPIAPLTGTTPATSASLDDTSMSDEAWMKMRRKQVAAKRH